MQVVKENLFQRFFYVFGLIVNYKIGLVLLSFLNKISYPRGFYVIYPLIMETE